MTKKHTPCSPSEIAVKSFFLGPNAENGEWLKTCIQNMLSEWFEWRRDFSSSDGLIITNNDKQTPNFIEQQKFTESLISELNSRFKNEIPKFSPRYIGHMFSEISMPALLGHILTLLHNPNNISHEASKVGVQLETEAIKILCTLMGYTNGVGHFTSGGTVANFEFVSRARERIALWLEAGVNAQKSDIMESAHMGWVTYDDLNKKFGISESSKSQNYLSNIHRGCVRLSKHYNVDFSGPVLIVPRSKHYSWPKAAHLFGIGEENLWYIELDSHGRADPNSLKKLLEKALYENKPILGVVAIAGTTELGSIDPIHEFQGILAEFKNRYGFDIWLHIDAAYGGIFRCLINGKNLDSSPLDERAHHSLEAIQSAHSVTLDPHKLGYVPYASGVFMAHERRNYFIRSFTGPYIISESENVGNYTLEGSRSAAGAVATWLSFRSLEFSSGYAQVLKRTITARKELQEKIQNLNLRLFFPEALDTNILCFVPCGRAQTLSEVNQLVLNIFTEFENEQKYWISKTTLHTKDYSGIIRDFCKEFGLTADVEDLHLLRITIMNPFLTSKESHTQHLENFCQLLMRSCTDL